MPGSQRQSSWVKPCLGFHVISRLRRMMPPCGIHMTVSAQANGDDHVSKARRLILKKLDLQRCEVLDIEGGRGLLSQGLFKGNETKHQSRGSIIQNQEDIKSISPPILDMSDKDIIEYYRTRFQIEFCFGIPNSLLDSMIVRQETWMKPTCFQCVTGFGKHRKGHAPTVLSVALHRTAKKPI